MGVAVQLKRAVETTERILVWVYLLRRAGPSGSLACSPLCRRLLGGCSTCGQSLMVNGTGTSISPGFTCREGVLLSLFADGQMGISYCP